MSVWRSWKPTFPKGALTIPHDSSRFVKISIAQVAETLVIAVVLVFLVLFCRISATPSFPPSVPVALLGTFAVLLGWGSPSTC